MTDMHKIINLYYRTIWYFRLRLKVNGRLKLCGNLRLLKISKNFSCDGDLWIGIYSDNGSINIGENLSSSGPLIITAINHIEIGNNLLLGPNVLICDHYHGDSGSPQFFYQKPLDRPLVSKGEIIISDNVHIGFNVIVLSGAVIEAFCVVGANSVVLRKLLERSVYAGNPARLISSGESQ
jgi:acetyltransferase-like isoleucine patch superfamily enzyme